MTIAITRSFSYSKLAEVVTSERIYDLTSDDFSPPPAKWLIPECEDVIYLLAREGERVLGFCAFVPRNGVTYEVHVCFLKCAYGQKALSSFIKMIGWMWGVTRAQKLVGFVPDSNPLAVNFARRAGFAVCGVIHKSWMKRGRLHDQICLELSRP
jgi:L-amino acid N-acyltransferase YncA